jgi:hypothetical protein
MEADRQRRNIHLSQKGRAMPATIPLRLPAKSIRPARVPRQARWRGLIGRLLGVIPRSHGFDGDRELMHRLSFADIKLSDELERRITEHVLRNHNLRL